MSSTILLCTVGGSHQPILEAIRSTESGHVCFFCTGRDPATGRPGSVVQITGTGHVIKAHRDDDRPTLPNIPTQAGLPDDRFTVEEVSADDLDQAFFAMRAAIGKLTDRFPDARFVADYTGGTKTMTAALVCTALESDAIELQLVTGARPTLGPVSPGSEMAMLASVARIRLDRTMAPYLAAWGRFAYREAACGLGEIRFGAEVREGRRLVVARALSEALALWDDFDHKGALDRVGPFASEVARRWPRLMPALRMLTQTDRPQNEPARLFDLWRNAERRAHQGRFDDAVARVYRLIEWVAQWQLRTRLNLDTADFPHDRLPADSDARPGQDGKIKLGLTQAWRVVGERLPEQDPVRVFAERRARKMLDLFQTRNNSILAHGFRAIQRSDWDEVEAWIRDEFLPLLKGAAREVGLKEEPPQLPSSLD